PPRRGFFFSSRRRHTRFSRDWSSDVCSSDLSVNVSFFSPGFLVSLIQYCFFLLPRRAHSVRAHYIRGRHYGAAAVIESGDFPDQIGRASCRKEWRGRRWTETHIGKEGCE